MPRSHPIPSARPNDASAPPVGRLAAWAASRTASRLSLGAGLGVAVLLVLVPTLAHRSLDRSMRSLVESEMRSHFALLMPVLRERGDREAMSVALDRAFAVGEPRGLAYAALVLPFRVLERGTPASGLDTALERASRDRPRRLGSRIRASTQPPPPPEGFARPAFHGHPPGPHPPPLLVVEFEADALARLEREASRALVLGIVAAAVYLLLAALLVVSTRERERLARERERLAAEGEATRRLAALGEMSAVLAHEIRNPIASLLGHAQLLEERFDAESPEGRKAARVAREATRLQRLVRDLLTYAKAGDVRKARLALRPLLLRAMEHAGLDPASDLRCAEDVRIVADEGMLERVFENLFVNAKESGAREIGCEVDFVPGAVSIAVFDSGPGIDPSLEGERLFETFATGRARGTGLGLSFARRIVEQHGGTLRAENRSEGGARFVVILPEGEA